MTQYCNKCNIRYGANVHELHISQIQQPQYRIIMSHTQYNNIISLLGHIRDIFGQVS